MNNPPTPPALEFAFELVVDVGSALDLGLTQNGHRRIVSISGGHFEGPAIRGRVLPGGADWQILDRDGAATLDARYTFETDQGALIYVNNLGIRGGAPEVLKKLNSGERVDPGSYYFRTVAWFETSAPECEWLTRSIFLGVGERYPDKVMVRFWRVG